MSERPEEHDRDQPPKGSHQRITFLGSQPPVGPPRNANVPIDRAIKPSTVRATQPESQRPTPKPEPQPDPENQKFPAVLLIAPGFIALLFAASAAQFVGDGTGKKTAMLIGFVGMLGAIACFATLAAFSREKNVRMFAAVMIGVALLAYAQSFLALS
jgi:hypothetical protein